jgi:hypothetical protein
MEKSKVSEKSHINDTRKPENFKGITFSEYKKTEVKNALIENLIKGKIEQACHWSAELICAGHLIDVWETIIFYFSKYIHLGNPKLIIYLDKRYSVFRNIMLQGFYITELQLRNNETIRQLFSEIICNISLSTKKNSFEILKINREEEYDITQLTDRLKAPSIKYIDEIFKEKDPKEIFIALNEFSYNLSDDRKNMNMACYWLQWLIDFDIICKNKKEPCFLEIREIYNVENKYKKDIIWIIWDILLVYSNKKDNFIQLLVASCLNLFCVKYTTASCRKRIYLLYYTISLLTEIVPTNIDIITNKTILYSVVEKIDEVYKQIKKNEIIQSEEYLYTGLNQKQKNLQKSFAKMEILNDIFNHDL